MKKIIPFLLLIAFVFCSCGKKSEDGEIPSVLNTTEYALYQNIFYNDTAEDYVGEQQTKIGTFAKLFDSYNDCIRYYVWGYNDQTKCCDWQWEFVPTDEKSLPTSGSLVEVKGTFAGSEEALDGYWLENAEVKVRTAFDAPERDLLMTTMDDTLERVQIYNIMAYPENYEGKSIQAYGRIASPTSFTDPYYDGSWSCDFASNDNIPAIGTIVILDGVCRNGTIADCTITETNIY